MKYKKNNTDKNGRVEQCLECENDEMVENADYCHICGKPIINYCTVATSGYDDPPCTHVEPLPANARYCPFCGSETTFLREELLDPWKKEFDENSMPSNTDFPVLLDDGSLPF